MKGINPSEFPEVQGYHEVVNFLKFQVDMLFEDLRVLLQLPLCDLRAGCNFTTAAMLFNIIAGISVCFYDALVKALTQSRDRGIRFKKLLIKYYPWEDETVCPETGSKLLYEQTRNPLAHSLGLIRPPRKQQKGKKINLTKRSLTVKEIEELETSPKKPTWLSQTIIDTPEYINISVPTVYWGVHRLLHKLFADQEQMKKANEFLKAIDDKSGTRNFSPSHPREIYTYLLQKSII